MKYRPHLIALKELAFVEKDISFLVLILAMFFLPLSINISTFLLIFSITLKLIQKAIKKTPFFETKGLKTSFKIALLFFGFIVLNSIFQANFDNAIDLFEKQYSHFALLFFMPMLLKSKKHNTLVLFSFFIGVLTAITYVMLANQSIILSQDSFINTLDIHHTYLAMYLLLLVNILLIRTIKSRKQIDTIKILLVVLLLVFSLMVIYSIDSKISMLTYLLIFLLHLSPEFSKKKFLGYGLILASLIVVFIVFNKKIGVGYEKALDFRVQIWDMSIDTFFSNSIFGDSSLPEKDILNYQHYLNGKYFFVDSDLNSHNQYLSFLMRFGLVGTVIFSLFMVNYYKLLNRNSSVFDIRELLGFLLIISMVFYIENILDRHHGIMAFSFFYNYYLVRIENSNA